MRDSFDKYWAASWQPSSQPAAFDAAFREVAMKAWNAAIESSAVALAKSDADIRLMAGELTAGELRTAKAVLNGCVAEVRNLTQSQ